MAFFEKLSDMAKNIGDKTGDAIETTKLNSKIKAENEAADEELKKIGAFYYEQFKQSGEAAPELLELFQTAKSHYDAAAVAQAEIDRIKAENEEIRAAAENAPVPAAKTAPEEIDCPGCGAANIPGTKFCCACGIRLESPAPAKPEQKICPGCGTIVAPGVKFCPECGNRME